MMLLFPAAANQLLPPHCGGAVPPRTLSNVHSSEYCPVRDDGRRQTQGRPGTGTGRRGDRETTWGLGQDLKHRDNLGTGTGRQRETTRGSGQDSRQRDDPGQDLRHTDEPGAGCRPGERDVADAMDPSALELWGVLVCGGAWLCSLATTLAPAWLTLSSDLLPAERYELGLWGTCVVQDAGALHCRPYGGLLALPPDIRLCRVLMCATLAAGLLALLLAIPGMHLVNGCPRRRKRALKAGGGVLSLAAGVLGLVPVSHMAHLAVARFFHQSAPEVAPRWDLGAALFGGWSAGVLHLAAGMLLLTSCRGGDVLGRPVSLPRTRTIRRAAETRSEYV
ncbi:putative claudin-24 [Spinachia spinachia]